MSAAGQAGTERVEALVIGAGAAGACAVWTLANAGVEVLCLEQGEHLAATDLPKANADWQTLQRHAWNPNPAWRRAAADYPVTNRGGNPVNTFVYSGVGGSVLGWGGAFWRFSPSDLKPRSTDGFGRDWPIGYEDLVPYWELNEREMGVSGLVGDPTHPPTAAPPLPPISMGAQGERWIDGFERLGWYWWVQHLAIASRDYRDRPGCTNRGFCTFGCPTGSLATPANTYWPRALAAGAELRTGARVERILVEGDRAVGARYLDADGLPHDVRADVVVLAANGIGTPRLLLMSADERHPTGLANRSDQVGRNLMVHAQTSVVARFPERTDADHGSWGATVTTRHFAETDPEADHRRGFIMTAMRGFAPLDTALAVAPWGTRHHEALEEHLNHEAVIWICGDDEPEPHNRVELDREHLDRWGLPGVTTSYTLSENSKRLLARGVARAKELAAAAGADSVRETGTDSLFGWHLLGTARMGDDPLDSVVDRWGHAHDVEGLWIVDGSVMPAGGTVNPTHTVQAVALRAAQRLVDTRAQWSTRG